MFLSKIINKLFPSPVEPHLDVLREKRRQYRRDAEDLMTTNEELNVQITYDQITIKQLKRENERLKKEVKRLQKETEKLKPYFMNNCIHCSNDFFIVDGFDNDYCSEGCYNSEIYGKK